MDGDVTLAFHHRPSPTAQGEAKGQDKSEGQRKMGDKKTPINRNPSSASLLNKDGGDNATRLGYVDNVKRGVSQELGFFFFSFFFSASHLSPSLPLLSLSELGMSVLVGLVWTPSRFLLGIPLLPSLTGLFVARSGAPTLRPRRHRRRGALTLRRRR